MRSHPSHSSFPSQTSRDAQNPDQIRREGMSRIFAYLNTRTTLRQGSPFRSFGFPASPIFLPVVIHLQSRLFPEIEYPWQPRFFHHRSGAYRTTLFPSDTL